MPIKDIALVSIPVTDQNRARDFYVDVLGFTVEDDEQMGDDMRWLQVGPAGGTTTIALVTWFDTMPPGSIKGAIQDQPWGRFAEFNDPDGNGWLLVQPS